MKKIKNILQLLSLSLCLTILLTGNVFAYENSNINNTTNDLNIKIYSEEFPDAYIEQTFTPNVKTFNINRTNTNELVGTISGTVYYEESYENVDGKTTCINSKLLSKEEINEIKQVYGNGVFNGDSTYTTNSYGKLSIVESVSKNNSTDSFSYYVSGTANWNSAGTVDGKLAPSYGEDYMGIVWGGSFDYYNEYANASDVGGNFYTVYDDNDIPDTGHIWRFEEVPVHFANPITNANCGLTINKNTLTGNGNTTSVVFKYIHTYEATQGSISISETGASFTLQGVSKQWGLSTKISNIKY